MQGKGKRIKSVVLSAKPVVMTAFAVLFALGIGLGYCRALRFSAASEDELRRYFSAFAQLRTGDILSGGVVLQTVFAFFRGPLFAFLLGFASLGVLLLPLLCLSQGFLFSFSLFCCCAAMGKGSFLLVLLLFLLRFLSVLPCTLLLSEAAFSTSWSLASYSFGKGKRAKIAQYGAPYFARFGICCIVLLICSILELWLIPRILPMMG